MLQQVAAANLHRTADDQAGRGGECDTGMHVHARQLGHRRTGHRMLLSYTGGRKYIHGNPQLVEGLDFAAGDPSLGDASLIVASLSPSHSATYQCKVKKSPGVDMWKVSLVVMVKPSKPKCWVEGGEEVGMPVSLHCKSDQGSTPLSYAWTVDRVGPVSTATIQNSVTGELLIRNHSESFAGVYLCEVTNAVGAERCRIRLRAVKPPNRAGVIAGTVVGSLLLLIIIVLLFCVFLYKWRGSPRYEKEVANEIREDAPAPESRPGSRGGSLYYSQVPSSQTGRTDAALGSNSTGDVPLKYDRQYGYIV
ncbi:V-set and immunoglobulin domain-containing protein 8a isoform X2 [Hypomesus transpacificus]|uniref:V-set and immunoglobulin domain-containing protein 8a isoform X2 n=1 Tax=Hypomesus transpacificus TaxID=137520 RepID=UPI001F07175E|nr:V-set and immunoglobulin domain-containing protein 8a isoform X2 [Hypomesus transpacificus]